MIFLPKKPAILAVAAVMLTASYAVAQSTYDPMSAGRGGPKLLQQDEEAVATNPEFANLPDTEGMEDTYYQCVACHSMTIIKQQSLSDARWDYLWHWMVDEQGMVEPDEETKELILSYLKRHFSSEN